MSKEIKNEKASSNGFSVNFPLAKEEEMGNKKASSNGISISFPIEAEMEKYDNIVKKLFDFIQDRVQSKETENKKASSKGISMIRFPLARIETGNENTSYKDRIRFLFEEIYKTLTDSSPKSSETINVIGVLVYELYKTLSGPGRSQPEPGEQANEQLAFPGTH